MIRALSITAFSSASPVTAVGWKRYADDEARPRQDSFANMCYYTYARDMTTTWLTLSELTHPGDAIRERRIELGWTQTELATRSGVPQADISRIENGRLDARWSTIQRISAELARTTTPPKRSIANGNKTGTAPTRAATSWTTKRPVLKPMR